MKIFLIHILIFKIKTLIEFQQNFQYEIWFLYLIWDTRKKALQCLAFSMIFAGAVGNIIDRISLDFVVDMFDFYYRNYHFATFNVADSSISIAAGIYLIDYLVMVK